VRSREQNAITFVAEREATELDCLAYTRGDNDLIFDDVFKWAKVAVDESCKGIS
jgi:hypothetical protein